MTQPFDRLNEIAAAIAPHEEAYLRAWKFDTSANMDRALTDAAAALNAVIEPFVDEVARITKNSAATIRQAYRPTDAYRVWFGGEGSAAEFLRNVAKHGSFNTNFWAENQRRLDEAGLKATYVAQGSGPAFATAAVAAADIAAGRIPQVDERQLSELKEALLKAGVLERYNMPQDRNSYFATRPFAFIAANAGEFCFWPAQLAANHVVATPLALVAAPPADTDIDTNAAEPPAAPARRPRPR